ncbi:MAG: hypothetical protein B6D39_10295 [Anaerolineae bacterium UTCFX2]|jgi:hypothetical protein|nr:hypothetical protein [Anaerolineales bacterium]OQY89097.1 MAG: hypothetical protein B6D39_10295 [Anaerolineae bacterium UTCFX2]
MDETKNPAPSLSQPFALRVERSHKLFAPAAPLRAGDRCPVCGQAVLDYDGLLNLVCPHCGFTGGGGCHT